MTPSNAAAATTIVFATLTGARDAASSVLFDIAFVEVVRRGNMLAHPSRFEGTKRLSAVPGPGKREFSPQADAILALALHRAASQQRRHAGPCNMVLRRGMQTRRV